jgi:hypothetical protein
VCAWRVALEARGLGAVSINVRITAVRKLALEAADNGLLAPELAAGITRVKGVASKGVRLGNWLSIRQAQTLLNAPDATTTKGLRDRAILAVLLGCGLRRSEVAALTISHVQQRDGRWCIVDLVGKHGRVRTIPMPTWVKVATDAWTSAAGVADGYVFRPVNRAAACLLADIEPETTEWPGESGTEIDFVLSRNIHRRQMSESQRAMAAALAAPIVKSIDLGGNKVANLPPGPRAKTAEILGRLFNVSERSVRHAMKISDSECLREAVQSGRCKVSAVFRLAKLPAAEQRQKLEQLLKAKLRTPAAAEVKDGSPSVPYYEVDLNAPEFDRDLARPNLTSDTTVVIKADSLQIGAAVALLSQWKVAITDVRCEHGAFEPGAVRLIGLDANPTPFAARRRKARCPGTGVTRRNRRELQARLIA